MLLSCIRRRLSCDPALALVVVVSCFIILLVQRSSHTGAVQTLQLIQLDDALRIVNLQADVDRLRESHGVAAQPQEMKIAPA